jgi:hypothetical protein
MVDKQRKGQWLYNHLRPESWPGGAPITDEDNRLYKAIISDRLWNMTDEEFYEVLIKSYG